MNLRGIPMSNINVLTIPHETQRYNTVGDYWVDENGVTQIRISDLGNTFYEDLIMLHELTLCRKAGVTIEDIDKFDFQFTENRAAGDASEPGDDPSAPYFKQHQFATKVEREMCRELGLDWDAYEDRISEVMETYPKP